MIRAVAVGKTKRMNNDRNIKIFETGRGREEKCKQ